LSNSSFKPHFINQTDAGGNILWVYMLGDEGRCVREIKQAAKEMSATGDPITTQTWSAVQGASWNEKHKDPIKALMSIPTEIQGNALVIMYDLHLLLNAQQNFLIRRALSELCKANSLSNGEHTRPIVILADTPTPYADIKDYCTVIDFQLPDYHEMRRDAVDWILTSIASANAGNEGAAVAAVSEEDAEAMTYALLGMSGEEAQRVLSTAACTLGGLNQIEDAECDRCDENHRVEVPFVTAEGQEPSDDDPEHMIVACPDCNNGLRDGVMSIISQEKAKVIRKIDGLTFIPHADCRAVKDIGGMTALVDHLVERKRSYTKHAQLLKMPKPRGVVLIGPPGTGKTMVAKAGAAILGLDLVLMDIGAMYDSLVGASEKKARAAFQAIDAMKNCYLVIDEIDKALAGAHKGSNDSGVSSRILSYFLTWLSERGDMATNDNRTFVMITANRVENLPGEMIRKGRFDEVFSTDLPDIQAREEILRIHMRLQYMDESSYSTKQMKTMVNATEDFSGAELEAVIIASRSAAYNNRMTDWENAGSTGDLPDAAACQPTQEELSVVAGAMIPLAVQRADDVAAIREFCQKYAIPVSGKSVAETSTARRKRGVKTSRGKNPVSAGDPNNN
jgi:SpoVK/Ycf46/Vps4 family AAA+-type ATPase